MVLKEKDSRLQLWNFIEKGDRRSKFGENIVQAGRKYKVRNLYRELTESVSFCEWKVNFAALVRYNFKFVLIFRTLEIF